MKSPEVLFIMELKRHWKLREWHDTQEHISGPKQMQKQNKFISNRKERPFPGISGRRWERTGPRLFRGNKEGIGLGLCVGASVPSAGRAGRHWLAKGWPRLPVYLSQTRVLASQLENLYFGRGGLGKEGGGDCVTALAVSGSTACDTGPRPARLYRLWGHGQVMRPWMFGPSRGEQGVCSPHFRGQGGNSEALYTRRAYCCVLVMGSLLIRVECSRFHESALT